MNIFVNLKKTALWKFFIIFFLLPIFNFLWINFFNYRRKFSNNLSKKVSYIINKKIGILKIESNEQFKNLAQEIFDYLKKNDILKKSKEEIINNSTKGYSKISKKNLSFVSQPFSNELFDELSESIKIKLVKLATSQEIVNSVSEYLGVYPYLHKIQINHKINRVGAVPRSSMLWHKDDFGYKCMDLWISITDIDEDNGPLNVIENMYGMGSFLKISSEKGKGASSGERGKVDLENFKKYESSFKNISLIGKKGTALFVDTTSCYHKGGFCKKNDRVILRIAYKTSESILNLNNHSKKIIKIFSNIENNLSNNENIILKKINKLIPKLNYFILYFIRIFHYKF